MAARILRFVIVVSEKWARERDESTPDRLFDDFLDWNTIFKLDMNSIVRKSIRASCCVKWWLLLMGTLLLTNQGQTNYQKLSILPYHHFRNTLTENVKNAESSVVIVLRNALQVIVWARLVLQWDCGAHEGRGMWRWNGFETVVTVCVVEFVDVGRQRVHSSSTSGRNDLQDRIKIKRDAKVFVRTSFHPKFGVRKSGALTP